MASEPNTTKLAQDTHRITVRLVNDPLATPMIELLLLNDLVLETLDGIVITLPAKTEIYLPPGVLGYGFFKSLQELVGQVQAEEEERWMRMTPEQVEIARSSYIPF